VLALMLNALVWGVSWWPFRQLQALGLHPLWTTVLVYGLSVGVILLWRPAALGQLLRSRALWGITLASGVTNAAFNWAVTIGEVVRVVLLFYLSPLWTVLLARWLLHERFSGRVALRVLLALAGAVLVLGVGGQTGGDGAGLPAEPVPRLADLLGLLAGATFALNNVLLRRESQRPGEGRALAMFSGGVLVSSAVAMAANACASASIGWPASVQVGWLLPALLLGLAFLFGNLALQYGATRLPANVTAVIMPTEIVFASVSAVWLGGEQLQPAVLAGGALILAATVLAARGEG
jgi:drug/metabolite transporter (DMT)-like permease